MSLLVAALPAGAQSCTLLYLFDDVKRFGVRSHNIVGQNALETIHLVSRAPLVGHDPCLVPGVEDWPAGVQWLYFEVARDDVGGHQALARCERYAVVAQNDPHRYRLSVSLVLADGDVGAPLLGATGEPWGYQVTFDTTSFITCSLIADLPAPSP